MRPLDVSGMRNMLLYYKIVKQKSSPHESGKFIKKFETWVSGRSSYFGFHFTKMKPRKVKYPISCLNGLAG